MPTRKEMIVALKSFVVPDLRRRGFTGSFPHFRRLGDKKIDLITFQFDKWGGGFVVEISKCGADGVTMPWGENIPPRKVTAHDMNPRDRFRLGCGGPYTDDWYRYDSDNAPESLAQEVAQQLDQAEKWWAG